MKSRFISIVVNSGLMVVVVLLLSTPLLMGQLLATYESGALGVSTTGNNSSTAPHATSLFAVYPNVADFSDYAAFSDQPVIEESFYQTAVTFTAFTGQQAAYNALFTIYNTSNQAQSIILEGGALSGNAAGTRVYATLVKDGQVGSTLVTESTESGAVDLRIGQAPDEFSGTMVVRDMVAEGQRLSQSSLQVTSPLPGELAVGDRVYFSPLFYNQTTEAQLTSTQTVSLQPQQKAVVNLAVETEAGDSDTSQLVLPLTVRAVGGGQ